MNDCFCTDALCDQCRGELIDENQRNKWHPVKEEPPRYDWLVVCAYHPEWHDGLYDRFAIARYMPGRHPHWDFWDTDRESTGCPACSDSWANIDIDEITHWMRLTFPGDEQ